MNSKSCIVFLFFLVLQAFERCAVSSYLRHIAKPTMYVRNEKIRSRVSESRSAGQYTDCGGNITKGPGTIEQHFVSLNPLYDVHCTWHVRAPEKHHVYVKQLRITHTTLYSQQSRSFKDAPFIEIFDGTTAGEDNRLYKFGDKTLNRCLSSGQDMVIELHYNESGKCIDQEAVIQYGFIEHEKVVDLVE